ncbi:carboxypeptidase regulatory-like domain-containing protein [Jiangella endophytica]|uniref:carboxypeptidase regulatory-like domain-containing protein n=1 Tax=Jiangella endophytica TaxID=1623398 RepID=UPI000E35791D|nr:carboxypeptidase-like regulatory domain-containing protein [Jiangella endophytica]
MSRVGTGPRVTASAARLDVEPGGSAELLLTVTNTADVIDGFTVRALGLPPGAVTARPPLLSLFPDAEGTIAVTVTVPPTHPAGRHPVVVALDSQHAGPAAETVDLDLAVPRRPAVALAARPSVVRSRGRAEFAVEVANLGNTTLDLTCTAADAGRATSLRFTPATLRLGPGAVATTLVTARAPRRWLGGDLDRILTAQVSGPDAEASLPLTLRQRPVVGRGLLTVLVLASIVALWAAAFLLGITQVLGAEPAVRTAPASFFAATQPAAQNTADGTAGGTAAPAAEAPAGALPKNGLLPPGVGGTITGTVTGAASGEPVGQITVEALRRTPGGLVVVSSAASQADGGYTLAGLFPGDYLVRFGADGYPPVWYPAAPDDAGAEPVAATAQRTTSGTDVVVTGEPASLRGAVDPGDAVEPVPATVTARPAWTGDDGASPAEYTATTAADGSYTLAGLPAPGSYELTFEADGYRPATVVEHVTGGQQRFVSEVRLATGDGRIAGVVTDGDRALGGVTVSTTVGDEAISAGTPTVGEVGRFVLPGLPTPGTYVLTFVLDGYAAQTAVVELAAGQAVTDLAVSLTGGAGTVSGTLLTPGGAGLGGATVTVGGLAEPVTTTTLTDGAVGGFTVGGLPPGAYTLTFEHDGYQPQTVPVTVSGSAATPPLTVTMLDGLGRVTGRVTDAEDGAAAGLTVELTDGATVWSTTSTGGGRYVLAAVPAGVYTVSVRVDGRVLASAVAEVEPAADTVAHLRLEAVR